MRLWRTIRFGVMSGLLVAVLPLVAADDGARSASAEDQIAQLKAQMAAQQQQIDQLRQALEEQRKLLGLGTRNTDTKSGATNVAAPATFSLPATKRLGDVASTMAMVPPAASPATPSALPYPASSQPAVSRPGDNSETSPLQLKIGNTYITPVGFMDMTEVSRSTNPGSGIGTNFGSIPYFNTQAASLTESRLSIQNSRIGVRFDSMFNDMKVLGYWESDFLAQIGSPPNGGLAVSSNPYPLRLRLYWVDVTKGKFEFLAGQSWSMMTPNRKGISPLPGDLFYSQDIDVNYQLGLVWGRIPGFRFIFHPTSKVAFGLALENSEPYVGGGNGGSGATLPAVISGGANATSGAVLGGQINNGSSTISAAALHPDIIAKLAFDPSSKFHFELAGVEITNKVAFPTGTAPYPTFTKAGGGGSVNLSFEIAKGVRLLTNNFWSAGGGRYIFGQAPDFIIRSNGSLSLVHSASTVTGLEANVGKTLYYVYYGGVYVAKNMALDANGTTKIGYGPISSDGQNRAIQEITFGTNTTLVKDSKWGALNLMFQYSYLQRNPWLVTGTAPNDAHVHMGFVNVRYTLPGSAPTMGK